MQAHREAGGPSHYRGARSQSEILLGLLFYGYAIDVFGSRRIERTTSTRTTTLWPTSARPFWPTNRGEVPLEPHPTDQAEAVATIDSIPSELGHPPAAALDTGFFSASKVTAFERRRYNQPDDSIISGPATARASRRAGQAPRRSGRPRSRALAAGQRSRRLEARR